MLDLLVMKNIFYLFLLSIFLITGCNSEDGDKPETKFNSAQIREITIEAIKGNEDKNNLLSGVIDLSLPVNQNYNKLLIDSLMTGKKKFYSLLLEFSNPIYNCFAIYDEYLKCYLIDRSINGYLSTNNFTVGDHNFISLIENFLTKDTIEIQRVSIYSIKKDSVETVFKTFTKAIFPKEEISQQIKTISDNFISTLIRQPILGTNPVLPDTFFYSQNQKKYISRQSTFESIILEKINDYNSSAKKKSISKLADIELLRNEISNTSFQHNNNELKDYSIDIDSTWQEINNFSITQNLKKEIKGTRYVNNRLGTTISVAKINATDSAESYFNQPLPNKTTGEYYVRFSNAFEQGKSILLFVEHSCKNKKYIIILEAPKFTYAKYKSLYENILNSFFIEC
ncbi:MAG: hypothetical protein IPJ03_18530 [Ignavibacteriales bacterium]|nr:hypothetical protein [Ignavibacteriales bacterium]